MTAMPTTLSLSRLFGPEAVRQDNTPRSTKIEESRHGAPGWLGIMMQSITPHIASARGLESTNGVLIANVVSEGPAAKAGLGIGHVITGYANRKIATVRDLARAVAETPAGTRVDLDVVRDGEPGMISITLEPVRNDPGNPTVAANSIEHGALGLSLGRFPEALRRQLGIAPDVAGALVVDVKPESCAGHHGIQVGDVVMRIDNTEVHDPIDASNAVKRAEQGQKKAVALLINRAGMNRFVGVPLAEARS